MTTMQTIFSAYSPTIAISGTSTASAAVGLPAIGGSIRMVNEGPNVCFVCISPLGELAVLPGAVPSDRSIPVLSGEDVVLGIPTAPLMISIICRATATCTLSVSVGEGI